MDKLSMALTLAMTTVNLAVMAINYHAARENVKHAQKNADFALEHSKLLQDTIKHTAEVLAKVVPR